MKTKILFIALMVLLFCSSATYSRQQSQARLDSLLKKLDNIREDTNGVLLLAKIAFNYQITNPREGLNYGFRALQLAKKLSWQKGIAECYNIIGTNYMSLFENNLAQEAFEKSLEINLKINFLNGIASNYINLANIFFRYGELDSAMSLQLMSMKINKQGKDSINLSVNLSSIGNIYMRKSDFSKALEYFMSALRINEELNRQSGIASNLQDIGVIYSKLKNYDKAIEYYERAKEINREIGRTRDLANNINNIAIIYFHLTNYNKALEYFLQSLQINLSIPNQRSAANNYSNIAETYKILSDYTKALNYLEKALELNESLNEKSAMASNYIGLGDLYVTMASDSIIKLYPNKNFLKSDRVDNLANGFKYLNLAIKICEELSDLSKLSQVYQKLSSAYEIQGDMTKALAAFKLHKALQDSIFSLDRYRVITEIETKHIREMKDQEIAKLRIESENQRLKSAILISSIIVLVVLIIVGIMRFREKKITNIKLTKQNIEISHQKSLLEERNEHIYSSIRYASTIQNAILPWDNTLANTFKEYFILYQPKEIVSGDCYWFQQIDGVKFLAVIDCTGHGVPGAMLSVIANSALDDAVLSKRLKDTSEILTNLNNKVTEILHQRLAENKMKDGMELGLIAIHKNKIQFSGAGRPLYIFNDGLTIYKTDRRGIAGSRNNLDYEFKSIELELSQIKSIYLTTDGFTDQMNEYGKKYGSARFMETLSILASEPFSKQKELLDLELERHRGTREQIDDVTILGLRI